jgi:hypothetical protein
MICTSFRGVGNNRSTIHVQVLNLHEIHKHALHPTSECADVVTIITFTIISKSLAEIECGVKSQKGIILSENTVVHKQCSGDSTLN